MPFSGKKNRPVSETLAPYLTKAAKKLKFVDLFCGIGGFRIAFERVGCECAWSCDRDVHAQKTYQANFGDSPEGDIYSIAIKDIGKHDILCAGFPCQPFSIAGVSKKISLGRKHGFQDEDQGNLFFVIAEILDHYRPKAFVLENVKNLKSHDNGRTFEIIYRNLTEALGYKVYYKIIDARSLVPQHRERIFIVGFRENRYFEFPQLPSKGPDLSTILEDNPGGKYTLSDHLWRYLQEYARKHKAAGNGFGFGLVGPKDVARTLSARYYKDGSEILIRQSNGQNPRRLTPRECSCLMGFPREFKIPVSDTQAYRQFGNSVVVPVVEQVAAQVVLTLSRSVGYKPEFALTAADNTILDSRRDHEARVSYKTIRKSLNKTRKSR